MNRRQVLTAASSASTACLLASGAALLAQPAAARPAQAIRPPGALAEDRFLSACVRCGLCVRDCPPQNLKLSRGTGDGVGVAIGTPFFVARDVPCEMCEPLPCVKACPTGALDAALTDITKAKMGVAVLIDQENCLNFLGLRCDVCYRVCPVIDQAITLEKVSNPKSDRHAMLLPTVHADACTGCGKCEKSCVLEAAAIKVLPATLARGELGHHYRRNRSQTGGQDAAARDRALPRFDAPVPRLPDDAQQTMEPLRSGDAPHRGLPAAPTTVAPK